MRDRPTEWRVFGQFHIGVDFDGVFGERRELIDHVLGDCFPTGDADLGADNGLDCLPSISRHVSIVPCLIFALNICSVCICVNVIALAKLDHDHGA